MTDIELYPGTPFCSTHKLNRIARQQGLCLAIAQASVFDEICVNVPLPASLEKELIQSFRCPRILHFSKSGVLKRIILTVLPRPFYFPDYSLPAVA